MSSTNNLQNLSAMEEYYVRNSKESLLEKYKIPIQNFDFDYVDKSNNVSELEKMVEVLRSGQEGHYPDLLKATEARLQQIRPNSKLLRRSCPVLGRNELSKSEQYEIETDLQNWAKNLSKTSKELDERKISKPSCEIDIRKSCIQSEPLELTTRKDKRIQSTDYASWDKYDPDTEITKMDLEEERIKKQADIKFPKVAAKKTVSFNKFGTEAEAIFVSDRELEKGREYFKSGDYEEALHCFTNSIDSKKNVTSLNNRALTFIKLKRYSEAYKDSEQALAIDSRNLKAMLRKSQALEGLKKYEESLDCVSLVIEKDPNNCVAQELADRVRKYCRNMMKNTRLKIVEIE